MKILNRIFHLAYCLKEGMYEIMLFAYLFVSEDYIQNVWNALTWIVFVQFLTKIRSDIYYSISHIFILFDSTES